VKQNFFSFLKIRTETRNTRLANSWWRKNIGSFNCHELENVVTY